MTFSVKELTMMKLKTLIPVLSTFMPIVKIDKNMYLLGTEVKQMQKMPNGHVIVTVGGGKVTIQEYFEQNAYK